MASLELVPHPDVLAVQAVVFLANLYVVKKLLIQPYMAVRERREALTVGSKDEAQRAYAKAETVTQKIEHRMTEVVAEAKRERSKLRDSAVAKRQALLDAAGKDARKLVEDVERQIAEELSVERAKIPAVVKALTDEVYKLALA